MKIPVVSVIIPAYNAAPYLSAAIQSVLGQTFSDLEIIVIDDGSTDGTGDVAASFGSRVQYLRTANLGPSAARNLGIARSTGRYIAFLDADDWWLPHKLDLQSGILFRNPDISFVCADWFNGETGEEPRTSALSGGYKAWEQPASFDLMLEENFVNTSTIVVERDKLLKAGPFMESLRGAEDRHLWLRLLSGRDAYVIKEILAFRRFHPGNTTATLQFIESQVMMIEDVLGWPEVKRSPARLEAATSRHNLLLVSLAYKLSTLGKYSESAAVYRQLYLESFCLVQSGIRYVLFTCLGILARLGLLMHRK
jgi:teichuronic acid biosynthesis glycosyltransferase TuaG